VHAAGAAVALLILASAVAWLQVYRDRHFRAAESAQQILYVRSPAAMKRLSLSFDAVVADLYWVRTIQYYGGTRLSKDPDKHYDLLYPMLDLTTSLDPQFSIAYRFGAFFLSERAPGGAGRPDLAIALLKKAMAVNPDRWEYPYDIGFVYYRFGQYEQAADWFRRAARVPGATNWLEPLAAVTLAAGGNLEASRALWQNLLATGDQQWLRSTAEHRLQQLDAIEEIQRLQSLTATYERRHGTPPPTWEDLVLDGALRAVPHDPAGYAYVLNPWWGLVGVGPESPLWPLPTERAP
jgi:tetratricopeptide (TPR) repeat protein